MFSRNEPLSTESLLALIWLALKNKVLVRIILHRFSIIFIIFISRSCCLYGIAAVVSLAYGLFQDFGMSLPAGEPAVDWVEGVAIMVAVLIVVRVVSPATSGSRVTLKFYRWSLGR